MGFRPELTKLLETTSSSGFGYSSYYWHIECITKSRTLQSSKMHSTSMEQICILEILEFLPTKWHLIGN